MQKSLRLLAVALFAAAGLASAALAAGPPAHPSPQPEARACTTSVAAAPAQAEAQVAAVAVAAVGREVQLAVDRPCVGPRVRIWPSWAVYAVPQPTAPPRPYLRT